MKALEVLKEAQKNQGEGSMIALYWAAHILEPEFDRAASILEKHHDDFEAAIMELEEQEQVSEENAETEHAP